MIAATLIPSRRPIGLHARAFSLIELMLAVSITTVIVAALYAVFNQTQRALRANTNQVDVLESGRSAMDTLARELSFLAPSGRPFVTNLYIARTPPYLPGVQTVPGPSQPPVRRTNILDEIYFLSRYNTDWAGTSFLVYGATNGVGTLVRRSYETHSSLLNATNPPVELLLHSPVADNLARIADGVIHFQVNAFDSRGVPITWYYMSLTNFYANVAWQPDPAVPTETRLAFLSNALPAYLEVELGILEPQTLTQFKSFPANADGTPSEMAKKFLSTHAGQVQLFRQRVPVRLGVSYPTTQK